MVTQCISIYSFLLERLTVINAAQPIIVIEAVLSASMQEMDVAVWRGDASGGGLEHFKVPAQDSQTILDVVAWIQQYADPTLSYRYACRVGMCGSCAMMVNGVPRWTCRTHVKKVLKDNAITIAPLRNLPVIKDLAVDMDPFFDKWVAAGGVHHPTKTRNEPIETIRRGVLTPPTHTSVRRA